MKKVKKFVYRYNREPDFVNLFNGNSIGRYYITWDLNHIKAKFPENDKGIPLQDWDIVGYRGIHGKSISPLVIAQTALAYHNAFSDSKLEEYKKKFLRLADWLVENQCKHSEFKGAWVFNYNNPRYQLSAPWICGMAQGQAICALVRAYKVTGDDRYIEAADEAIRIYELPINEGGVKVVIEGKYVQYEESPTNFTPHILNHTIYAVLGLFDLSFMTESQRCLKLYKEGVQSIREMLPNYDTGYWSRYELAKPTVKNHYNLSSPLYHATHVALLRVLYSITKDKIFSEYAKRWKDYQTSMFASFMEFVYIIFKASVVVRRCF